MIWLKYLLFAQTNSICPDPTKLCNPTKAGSLEFFSKNILAEVGIIIGIATIAMVVYSGFRMVVSQGNEEEVTKAKSTLQWSLAGLLLVMFAYIIVSGVSQFIETKDINPTPGAIQSPITSSDILSLSGRIFTNILSLIGLIAILFIIINGFRYITARGDDEQTSKAKQGLLWAVLGLVVTVMAYVIVFAVTQLFQG